jgi:hypothetical protein
MTEKTDAHIERVAASRWQAFTYFGLAMYLGIRLTLIGSSVSVDHLRYINTASFIVILGATGFFTFFFVSTIYLVVRAKGVWPVMPMTYRARFLFWPLVIAGAFELIALAVRLAR